MGDKWTKEHDRLIAILNERRVENITLLHMEIDKDQAFRLLKEIPGFETLSLDRQGEISSAFVEAVNKTF